MSDADTLRDYYGSLSDDALSQAYAEGESTYDPLAWSIVSAELQRRGLPRAEPPTQVVYAPLWNRVVGQFVDWIVAIGPAYVIYALPLGDSGSVILPLAWFAWFFFHILLADGMRGGQSLGKRMARTRVVHAVTGEPCTYLQSLARNLTLSLLGPIDWVWILGERRQRLGDMIVNTIVVTTAPAAEPIVAMGEQHTPLAAEM